MSKPYEDCVIKVSIKEVQKIIHKVKSNYPIDVFPNDGTSVECKAAKMARTTCDNIEYLLLDLVKIESLEETARCFQRYMDEDSLKLRKGGK